MTDYAKLVKRLREGALYADVEGADAIEALIRERDEARAKALEDAARHLERQPSFGDGKWAARHVRALMETEHG